MERAALVGQDADRHCFAQPQPGDEFRAEAEARATVERIAAALPDAALRHHFLLAEPARVVMRQAGMAQRQAVQALTDMG